MFEPPPEGYETWEESGRSIGLPEEKSGDQAAVIDPADEGPRLYFQRVPEGKTAKNRVHLDVRVAGREIRGEERKRLVSEKVEQLVQAGAGLAWETDDARGRRPAFIRKLLRPIPRRLRMPASDAHVTYISFRSVRCYIVPAITGSMSHCAARRQSQVDNEASPWRARRPGHGGA